MESFSFFQNKIYCEQEAMQSQENALNCVDNENLTAQSLLRTINYVAELFGGEVVLDGPYIAFSSENAQIVELAEKALVGISAGHNNGKIYFSAEASKVAFNVC